ncbi:TPA: glycosyltransferase, partial [Escherichia coli]
DIEFLGPMNHNELARWYKTINVLVYPSESESLGLVPLEAMSSGVYCILSKIPAFYEIRQHGLTFSFIENYDSQSIAREIENFQKINITHLNKILKRNSNIVNDVYGESNVKRILTNVFK